MDNTSIGIKTYKLSDHLDQTTLDNLTTFVDNINWKHGIPGGFVTNTPNRQVATYGDGSEISDTGEIVSPGWDKTYWTSKISQSNTTLETPTNTLPLELRSIIGRIRQLFLRQFENANATLNTFTLAVCNYYTDPDMTICAHTDDNVWYPNDTEFGNVFASFTFYPHGEPEKDDCYGRFQIKVDGKWTDLKLAHNTVTIMPSNIEHRVMAYTKKMKPFFKPRINITLRSTFSRRINPLMNVMAVANHNRYYNVPTSLYLPTDIIDSEKKLIIEYYCRVVDKYSTTSLRIISDTTTKDRVSRKKECVSKYRSLGFPQFRCSQNMVLEMFLQVLEQTTILH